MISIWTAYHRLLSRFCSGAWFPPSALRHPALCPPFQPFAILTTAKIFVIPELLLYLNYEIQRRQTNHSGMKQFPLKRLALAVLVALSVPATLFAQTTDTKDKTKEKTTRQQIVITRSGDANEKTVIEIDGDKVKVNGKDVADLKDIQVKVNNLKIPNVRVWSQGQDGFDMAFGGQNTRLFSTDSNRAMLGVVTESHDKGAALQSVTKDGGAEKAGLKKGDVITKIDNRKIDATEDVTDAIRSHKPGDKLTITYLRDGKEQKATAELGRWKGIDFKGMTAATPRVFSDNAWREGFDQHTPYTVQGYATSASRPKLGMAVQDTDDGKGVKVLNLSDEGTAAKAGLKEDDVITHIDDKAVNSADEISKLVKEKKDQPSMRFQVMRNGKSQNIEVRIPRKIKTVDL